MKPREEIQALRDKAADLRLMAEESGHEPERADYRRRAERMETIANAMEAEELRQ